MDVDNDIATGCSVNGMPGVDQVLSTQITTDESAGQVTRTAHSVCVAGTLGAETEISTGGWSAGFHPASGDVLVETRMPFTLFAGGLPPSNMRLGLVASQGAASHVAITLPGGASVFFPVTVGRRRAVGAPGEARVITLDGGGADWNGLHTTFEGIAGGGSPALRIIKHFAFADLETDFLYFRFDANLSSDAPFATDDAFERPAGEGLTVPAPGVLENDGDPNDLPLTALPVTPATHGTVVLNPDGSFTYTPVDATSTQADSFEYKASNGSKTSNAARVEISVTTTGDVGPVANDDLYTTDEDADLAVVAPGVLANDADANGDPLTASLVTAPLHGNVTLNADGGFTYEPDNNYFGTDTFTYSVSDGTASDTATVTITIVSANDRPVVAAETFTIPENSAAGTTVGTVDVSDADGGDSHTFAITGGNTGGAFAINPTSGTITVANSSALDFEVTPQFLLTVVATDDGVPSRSDSATITIDVLDVNDVPVTVGQVVTTAEDTPATITLVATDEDGDTLTWTIVSPPANGTLSGTAPNLTYTPSANYFGNDSFTFRVNDGAADSNLSTVSISVTSVNDVPVAAADGYTVAEGGTINEAAPGVLSNDSDVEGPLSAVLDTNVTNGTLTLNADGSFTYVHNGGETTSDSFTYHATDGVASSSTVTVSITVTPVNDVPVAASQTLAATEDVPLSVTLTATDGDGDGLSYTVVSGPANGSLTGVAPNLTYTPNANFFGADSFTFTANDGTVDSNVATITINVAAVNDLPVAAADGYVVAEGGTINQSAPGVLGNDSDVEGPLTAVLDTNVTNGSLTLNGDGSFTYVHNGGETTTDSFTYHATDGVADSATVTVTITVTPVNDAPVNSVPGAQVTTEDVTLTFQASSSNLVSISDADAGAAAVEVTLTAANGTVTLASTTGLTFTVGSGSDATMTFEGTIADINAALSLLEFAPTANFSGPASLTIATDDRGNTPAPAATDTDVIDITVTAENDAPVAVADSYSVAEGGTLNEVAPGVLSNDSDVEGPLTAVLDTDVANGTLTLNADGSFTYVHDGGETTSDSFTYHATDGVADSSVVTVTITVTPVNDAPVAVADSGYTVDEAGTLTGASTVLGNDTDAELDSLTAILVSAPVNASAFTLNADGTFDYTHDGGETTSDSFTYRANDGALDSNIVTVSITVTPVNDTPVATADAYGVAEGGTLNETIATGVLSNDTDPDSTLTAVLVSGPSNAASFTLNADGSFTYTHDGSETTTDSFTYKANDGTVDSGTVAVTITVTPVNDAPVAVADGGYTVAEGGTIAAAATVLGNDTDAENDTLTAALVSGPSNASSFTLNADGTFDYTHDGGETTSDSFTYKANDGAADSNTVTVSITITAVNDAPVAVADSGYTLGEGGTLTGAATVLGNDTDAENDTLTAILVSGPANASSFTLNPDGTFDYTHNGGETTSDSFTYKANDGAVDSNTVTVSITINAVNDAPVAVADGGYAVNEGGTIPAAATVLGNDTDAEGSTLTAILVSGPANASSFTLNPDGTFAYTHNGGETTSDSFTYKANDGTADSNTVTVSITINALNDAPVAVADSGYAVNEGGTITGAATVLGNDTDAENDTLTAVLVSGPANASSFTLNADGTFDYTHNGSETTSDSFTYKANDGTADSNTVTVSITINALNDAPVAVADSGYAVNEGGTITGAATVLGNDTDAENDTLTAVLVSGPANASSFTLNADGTFNYTHNGGETTSDSFTYKANDGTADSNTVTVSITINAVNDAPVAVADSGYAVNEGGTITGAATVLGNDTDPENDTLTAVLVSGPSNASSFTLNADGTFDYTHNGSESLSDSFTYKANDGGADSNTVTVSITINALNDAPVAVADSGYSVDEGGTITNAATVLTNDSDAELSPLTAILVTGPSSASSFTLDPDGTFDYTHDGGETTSDSFTYKANDGTADSNTVTVSITINTINDAPSFTKGPDIDADSAAGPHTSNPWATAISAGTGETQNVTFVIDSNDNAGLFSTGPAVSSTGVLTFDPVFGATGVANITLHIEDDGGTANGGIDASATQSFVISLDASPTVDSTDPAEADVVGTNKQVTVTFNEPVTLAGTWFQIVCATSGTHDPGNSTVGGSSAVYTIDTAGFTGGESCTMTIFGAQVTDDDTIDPPNVMTGNTVVNFTVDAAPTVTSTTPANAAVNQATDLDIVINFSEAVAASAADFSIECPVGSAQAFSATGTGTSTITLNPTAALPAGTTCTVKVLTSVTDSDTIDPPNALAAQHVFTFTTDAEPAVTTVSPVDETTDVIRSTNITINFSENVDTTASSFTIKCPSTGSALPFTFVGASSGTSSVVLDPVADLPDGERCEVTVLANQVNDTDTNDPPQNLAADFTFQFGVEPNADDDTHPHTLVGNIASNSDGYLTVVTNDDFPVAFPITGLTFDATTVNGGTVVLNNTIGDPNFGEFTYNPPPGFEGTDTFTYTITTANGSDTGTVSIPVSGMVWFINANDVTGPFDGRLESPFSSLAQFEAVNGNADVGNTRHPQAGDNIFLYESGSSYVGPVTLENNQKLVGQDSATSLSAISGLTPGASQSSFPVVNSGNGTFAAVTSASNGVVLAQGNHVRGLRFGNNTGLAMFGGNVGTLTVTDSLINNGTGGGVSLSTGTASVTFASLSTSGGTVGIALNGVAGTFAANGGTIANPTTAAVSITGSNPAVTFTGTISVTNGRPGLLTSNLTGGSIGLNTVNVSGTLASQDAITLDGTGNAVDLSITSATLNTSNMDDGIVLSDLGSGSDVTISGGTVTSTGAGRRVVELSGNVNCTCNLAAVTLSGNSSDGLSLGATHLGTYQFGDLDVNTPNGGVGVQVVGDANAANTDSSVTFKSIDVATCSQAGIYVHSHSGSFTVNGTGAAGSGGTISNCTQRGAKFGNDTSANTGAKNITLTDMNFTGNGTANLGTAGSCGDLINGTNTNCAAGIDLQQAQTVTLTRVAITNGAQNGLNGRNVTSLTLNNVDVTNAGDEANENGVNLHNLFGTSTWTQLDATENAGSQMEIQNATSTSLNLTINGGTFSNAAWPGSLTSSHGVLFSGTNNAQMTLSLQSANIARNYGPAFQSDSATGADINVTVNNGTMSDNGQHFVIASTGPGDMTYSFTNIQMYVDPAHTGVTPISIARGDGASGIFTGVIQGNTIGQAGLAGSGAPCSGCNIISVRNNGSSGGANRVTIGGSAGGQGNTLQRSMGGGINVTGGLNISNDSGVMQVKIISNTLTGPDGGGTGLPITIVNGTAAADTSQTCADVLNNVINGGGGSGSWNLSAAIRLRHVQNTTVYRLPGYTGGGNDTTAVQNYLQARNSLGAGTAAAALGAGTYGNTSPAGSQCF